MVYVYNNNITNIYARCARPPPPARVSRRALSSSRIYIVPAIVLLVVRFNNQVPINVYGCIPYVLYVVPRHLTIPMRMIIIMMRCSCSGIVCRREVRVVVVVYSKISYYVVSSVSSDVLIRRLF